MFRVRANHWSNMKNYPYQLPCSNFNIPRVRNSHFTDITLPSTQSWYFYCIQFQKSPCLYEVYLRQSQGHIIVWCIEIRRLRITKETQTWLTKQDYMLSKPELWNYIMSSCTLIWSSKRYEKRRECLATWCCRYRGYSCHELWVAHQRALH